MKRLFLTIGLFFGSMAAIEGGPEPMRAAVSQDVMVPVAVPSDLELDELILETTQALALE